MREFAFETLQEYLADERQKAYIAPRGESGHVRARPHGTIEAYTRNMPVRSSLVHACGVADAAMHGGIREALFTCSYESGVLLSCKTIRSGTLFCQSMTLTITL